MRWSHQWHHSTESANRNIGFRFQECNGKTSPSPCPTRPAWGSACCRHHRRQPCHSLRRADVIVCFCVLAAQKSKDTSPATRLQPLQDTVRNNRRRLGPSISCQLVFSSFDMMDLRPRPGADNQPGLALQQATRHKRRDTYLELSRSPRCHHVVFAVEIGGCWGSEPATFLRLLARARTARALAAVRSALCVSLEQRHRCRGELPLDTVASAAGGLAVHEVLKDKGCLHAPAPSRPRRVPRFPARCRLPARIWTVVAVGPRSYWQYKV